jgi:hypothetical protein
MYNTYVTNQYVTNTYPTTVLNQQAQPASNANGVSFVSPNLFYGQVDRIYDTVYDSLKNRFEDLDSDLADSFETQDLTVSGSIASNGQLTETYMPTLAHQFTAWPAGTSNVQDASLYINPSSAAADSNLLGLAVGGDPKFLVDAEGDIYGSNLILTGSTSAGSTVIAGDLTVQDDTSLGDAATDTINLVGTIKPVADSTADILAIQSTPSWTGNNYLNITDSSSNPIFDVSSAGTVNLADNATIQFGSSSSTQPKIVDAGNSILKFYTNRLGDPNIDIQANALFSFLSGSSNDAYNFNTQNTIPNSDKLVTFQNGNADKAYIYGDGGAYFAGNVGIGTSDPDSGFEVAGAACFDTAADTHCTAAGTAGDIYYGTAHANWTDVAEKYPSKDDTLEPGDVVMLDAQPAGREAKPYIQKADGTQTVMGIISEHPGILLGDDYGKSEDYSLALSGRVPVKVTDENGEVEPGDYLTVSQTVAGFAMKQTENGDSIGIALTGPDEDGKVLAMVGLSFRQLNVSQDAGGALLLNNDQSGAFTNVTSIASASGNWSIGADGTIQAKVLCLDDICINKDQLKTLLENNGLLEESHQAAPTEDESQFVDQTQPEEETQPQGEAQPEEQVEPQQVEPQGEVQPEQPISDDSQAPVDAPTEGAAGE